MWLDRQRNVVVYDTPEFAKITASVPGAVRLHNGYVAAPATLYNLQLLRWLGFKVPAPMDEAGYDWPGKFTPFQAQRVTSNFLTVHPRAFVLSDMGTGKTLAALWAADFIMRSLGTGLRCLIVAPLSTLQRVWSDAIFQNFLGRRTCRVLHGDAAKRRQLLSQPADFYIVNFDGVGVLAKELADRADIRMVICDEASAYRDFRTKRHRLARQLFAKKDYLWLMTGTPTPNGPTDAYGLAKLVNNAFGETFTSYQARVMTKVSVFKWVPRNGSHETAHRLLQPSIRFAISDCIDLPPCTTQARDVELSIEQAKAYKAMKAHCVALVAKGQITAVNEAAVRTKLIQIACGAVYDSAHDIHLVDASPKLKALREVMQECNEKIIVFAPLTSVIQLLYKELKEYTRAVINGQVGHRERSETFRAFQDGNAALRVLIADPATMAHGLTLTAATTVVWYAPIGRTELYLQANKRIDRPGQTKATTIVQLAATPVEREIYRRLEANENLQGLTLKLARGEL